VDPEEFAVFLRRGGRSASAIERCLRLVSSFENYLNSSRKGTDLDGIGTDEMIEYIHSMDDESKSRSKATLWALNYYYQFSGNTEMSELAGLLREERMDRKPFALKDFRGVEQDDMEKLGNIGIWNVNHLLKAGGKREDRKNLSAITGIPEPKIDEYVKLADLARIPGVKGVRARLYYDAGIDSVKKIANLEPEQLRELVVDYVEESGFDGIPTQPAEAVFTVNTARSLPVVVDFSTDE
jgi:hypothetical protein